MRLNFKDVTKKLQALQKSDLNQIVSKFDKGKISFKTYKPERSKEVVEDGENETSRPISPEEPLATEQFPYNNIYFYHPDHLGTGTYLTDANGLPYQFFLNLPFGETMVEMHSNTENYASPYKFNGKELDAETGLYYYGARYYDPKVSNWYSVDPLAEKYPSWNPYNYTLQNPVNFIDPDGRDVIPWLLTTTKEFTSRIGQNLRNKSTRNFVSAMNDFSRTKYGTSFLKNFMKKGQNVYGFAAKENGKFSDFNINIVEVRLTGVEKGAVMGSSEGMVFPTFSEKGELSFTVYVDGDMSKHSLGEVLAHELAGHGFKIEKTIEAFKKGGREAALKVWGKSGDNGDNDHKALRDNDANHGGYRAYESVRGDLGKIDKRYEKVFENQDMKDVRRYKNIN